MVEFVCLSQEMVRLQKSDFVAAFLTMKHIMAAVNVIFLYIHYTLYKFTYMYCVGVYVHILPLLKQLDKGRHASNFTP